MKEFRGKDLNLLNTIIRNISIGKIHVQGHPYRHGLYQLDISSRKEEGGRSSGLKDLNLLDNIIRNTSIAKIHVQEHP